VKTSSWLTYTGPGRIGISRATPRRTPGGYRLFRALAPGPWFRTVDRAEYGRLFALEILGILDPEQTWDQLHQIAGGAEPVLMCFERPPLNAGNWCHRTMVAEWFREHLGHQVAEL
jgi:hypothetical protein